MSLKSFITSQINTISHTQTDKSLRFPNRYSFPLKNKYTAQIGDFRYTWILKKNLRRRKVRYEVGLLRPGGCSGNRATLIWYARGSCEGSHVLLLAVYKRWQAAHLIRYESSTSKCADNIDFPRGPTIFWYQVLSFFSNSSIFW